MGVFSHPEGVPAVVGHRGVRRPGLLENTPAAFAAAAAEGATWVELDVRRCADDVLVVFHNGWLADGTPVVQHTAAALAEAGVATFDDVLATLPRGLGVNVEVKNLPGEPDYDPDDALLGPLAERIAAVEGQRPLLLSSFNPLTVSRMAAALPQVPCGLVHFHTIGVVAAVDVAVEQGAVALCSRVGSPQLDEEGVAAARAAGLSLMAWTVNDMALARRLAAAGIDALCTDDPGGLRAALSAA